MTVSTKTFQPNTTTNSSADAASPPWEIRRDPDFQRLLTQSLQFFVLVLSLGSTRALTRWLAGQFEYEDRFTEYEYEMARKMWITKSSAGSTDQ